MFLTRKYEYTNLVVLMADRDPGVVGDDSLVQCQNSLIPRLQPSNLKTNNNIYLDIMNLNNLICQSKKLARKPALIMQLMMQTKI